MTRRLPPTQTRTRYYTLAGGLDTSTPPLNVFPGRCLAMVNFEPYYAGGYRRCDGFERFDGRPAPSDAEFYGVELEDNDYISEGDTVTGDTSGATGTVVAVSGNWIAITKITGTFVEETLNSGTVTMVSAPVLSGAPDIATEDDFLLAAMDEYRDDIQVVPGTGPVRGAWRRDEDVYAVRDDEDSVYQAVLYHATSSGWSTSGITMCQYIFFDGGGGGTGQALPAEGATINGQTSGATGVVHRVVEHGGATGTNDSYGYLVLRSSTGNFINNENLRVSSTKFADSASGNAQFALPPGGRYRFINHNFFGSSSTYRTYGVNGVGPAFEIDEDHRVSPILLPLVAETDQPPLNTPFLIGEFRNYLFLGFPGGSLVHSVVGEPITINGFLGSAEFGIGREMTALTNSVGNVLVITTDLFTKGLYGSSPEDWELRLIAEKTGGKLDTVQQVDTIYGLDDLGVTSLARVQSFGDFAGSTVSQAIQDLIIAMRTRTTASTITRRSNQYRVYFDDQSCIVMYVPQAGTANIEGRTSQVEFGYLSYPFTVDRIYNSEDETGRERTYFLTDDEDGLGYVFEDQIGTSFDGEEIDAYVRLAFNHVGTPGRLKRFRRCDLELSSQRQMQLQFLHDLSYGSPEFSTGWSEVAPADVPEIDVFGGGGFWNDDNWDEFYWDGQNISRARAELDGTGENFGFVIYNSSAVVPPFVIQGLTLFYDERRLQR